MAVQIRRGVEANRGAVTFAAGELVFTTDAKKVFIGDGTTAGGIKIFEELYTTASKTKVDFITVTGAVDLDEVKTKALSALQATDIVNDLTTGGTTKVLSAEQGKVLKGLIDGLSSGILYIGTIDVSGGTVNVRTSTVAPLDVYDATHGYSKGDFFKIQGSGLLSDGTNTIEVTAGDMVIVNKDVAKASIVVADLDKIDNTESADLLRTGNVSTNADFAIDGTKLTDRTTIKTFVETTVATAVGTGNPMTATGDIIVGGTVNAGKAGMTRLAIGTAYKVLRVNSAGTTVEWGDVEGGSF